MTRLQMSTHFWFNLTHISIWFWFMVGGFILFFSSCCNNIVVIEQYRIGAAFRDTLCLYKCLRGTVLFLKHVTNELL